MSTATGERQETEALLMGCWGSFAPRSRCEYVTQRLSPFGSGSGKTFSFESLHNKQLERRREAKTALAILGSSSLPPFGSKTTRCFRHQRAARWISRSGHASGCQEGPGEPRAD